MAGETNDEVRTRPTYHYSSGAWMNDVIPFHDGRRLHVYFDHNPEAARWTRFCWGHASTEDLIHWRTEPVALAPTEGGPDAFGTWTGSVVAVDDGYIAAYTGITSFEPFVQVQCLARSRDLISWDQSPTPAVSLPPEGFGDCFRDPYLWRAPDGTWRMLVGSTDAATNRAAVLSYASADLHDWEYGGPLFVAQDDALGHMAECPELFELDGRMVLVMSCGQTRAVTGELDPSGRFVADGPVTTFDPGESYAARSFPLGARRIQFAWVRDTRDREVRELAGWSGALSLPRELTLRPDGGIAVRIADEVERLRVAELPESFVSAGSDLTVVDGVAGPGIELLVELAPRGEGCTSLVVGCDGAGEGGIPIDVDWSTERLAGHAAGPLDRTSPLHMRVFVDRSVVEVAVADRIVTLRNYDLASDGHVAVGSDDGTSELRVSGWQLEVGAGRG